MVATATTVSPLSPGGPSLQGAVSLHPHHRTHHLPSPTPRYPEILRPMDGCRDWRVAVMYLFSSLQVPSSCFDQDHLFEAHIQSLCSLAQALGGPFDLSMESQSLSGLACGLRSWSHLQGISAVASLLLFSSSKGLRVLMHQTACLDYSLCCGLPLPPPGPLRVRGSPCWP